MMRFSSNLHLAVLLVAVGGDVLANDDKAKLRRNACDTAVTNYLETTYPVTLKKNYQFVRIGKKEHTDLAVGTELTLDGQRWKIADGAHLATEKVSDGVNLVSLLDPRKTRRVPLVQKRLDEASIAAYDKLSEAAKVRKNEAIREKAELEKEYNLGVKKIEEEGLRDGLTPEQILQKKQAYTQEMKQKYASLEANIILKEAAYVEVLADSFKARGYIVEVESPRGFSVAQGTKRLKVVRGTDGAETEALSLMVTSLKTKKYPGQEIKDPGDDFYYDPTENRVSRSYGGAYWNSRELSVGHEWDQHKSDLLSMLEIHEVFHIIMDKAVSINPNVKPEQAMKAITFRASPGQFLPGSTKDSARFDELYDLYPHLKAILPGYMAKKNNYVDKRTAHEVEARFASAAALQASRKNPKLKIKIEQNDKMALDSLREALVLAWSDVKNIDFALSVLAGGEPKFSLHATLVDGNQIKAGYFNASILIDLPAIPGPPPVAASALTVPGLSFKLKPGETTEAFEARINEYSLGLANRDPKILAEVKAFATTQLENLRKVRRIMVDELARDFSDDVKIYAAVPRIRQRMQVLDDSDHKLAVEATKTAPMPKPSKGKQPDGNIIDTIFSWFGVKPLPPGQGPANRPVVVAPTTVDVTRPHLYFPQIGISNVGQLKVGQVLKLKDGDYQVLDFPVIGATNGWVELAPVSDPKKKIRFQALQKRLDEATIRAYDDATEAHQKAAGEIYRKMINLEKQLKYAQENNPTAGDLDSLKRDIDALEQDLVKIETKVVEGLAQSLRSRGYVVTIEPVKNHPGAVRLKVLRGGPETVDDVLHVTLESMRANRYGYDDILDLGGKPFFEGMKDRGDGFYYNPTLHRHKHSLGHAAFFDREVSMGSQWDHGLVDVLGMTDVHEGFHLTLRRAISLNPNVKPDQAMRAISFTAEDDKVLPGSKEDVKAHPDHLDKFGPEAKAAILKEMGFQYEFYSSYRAADEVDARIATVSAYLNAKKGNPKRKMLFEMDEPAIKSDLREVFILAYADVINIDHTLNFLKSGAPKVEAFWTYNEGRQVDFVKVNADGSTVPKGFLNTEVKLWIPATAGPPPYGAYSVTIPGKSFKIKPGETKAQFEARLSDYFTKIKNQDPATIAEAVAFSASQMEKLKSVRQVMLKAILPGLIDETKLLLSVERIKKQVQILRNVKYDVSKMPAAAPSGQRPNP